MEQTKSELTALKNVEMFYKHLYDSLSQFLLTGEVNMDDTIETLFKKLLARKMEVASKIEEFDGM